MGVKLFSKSKPISLYDMRHADPNRTPTDFSDLDYQHAANLAAGYQAVGTTERSTDGTLVIFQKDGKLFRAQNGVLYEREARK